MKEQGVTGTQAQDSQYFGPKNCYSKEQELTQFYYQMHCACSDNYSKAIWEWLRNAPCLDDFPKENFKLWKENGQTVCAVRPASPWPGEAVIDHQGASEHVQKEMIKFVEKHLSAEEDGKRRIFLVIFDSENALEQLLLNDQYEKVTIENASLTYDLEKEIEQVKLSDGFQVLPLDEVFDFDQLSKMFWYGFEYQGAVPKIDDLVKPSSIKHAWLDYRRDICSVVLDEQGEYVSFCGFWFDAATKTAYLEPMVTSEKYRHMGLGKAAVYHSLQTLKELGCKKASVDPDEAAISYYTKIGFHPCNYIRFFQKSF